MAGFANDTEVRERDGRLAATFSRDWEIWGPNGGYVSTTALRPRLDGRRPYHSLGRKQSASRGEERLKRKYEIR
jgi:hypothetical protein